MIIQPKITRYELLKDKAIPADLENNFMRFYGIINRFRDICGIPMMPTSFYRDVEDHLRIYREKGITDISKIPMKSNHLYCLACDFGGANVDKLKTWVKNNTGICSSLGLYFEDFSYTVGWLHVQIVPPASGKMFFVP